MLSPSPIDLDALQIKLRSIRRELRDEYLAAHAQPWIIGFSGGKDSTFLLHFVLEAIRSVAPKDPLRPSYERRSDNELRERQLRPSIIGLRLVQRSTPETGTPGQHGIAGRRPARSRPLQDRNRALSPEISGSGCGAAAQRTRTLFPASPAETRDRGSRITTHLPTKTVKPTDPTFVFLRSLAYSD